MPLMCSHFATRVPFCCYFFPDFDSPPSLCLSWAHTCVADKSHNPVRYEQLASAPTIMFICLSQERKDTPAWLQLVKAGNLREKMEMSCAYPGLHLFLINTVRCANIQDPVRGEKGRGPKPAAGSCKTWKCLGELLHPNEDLETSALDKYIYRTWCKGGNGKQHPFWKFVSMVMVFHHTVV